MLKKNLVNQIVCYETCNMNIRYDNKMILRKESDMFFYVEIDVVRM